ncbi:hypothetical protein Baya_9501 [Bagarius yarrelli]|uniref:Uncharacterized protein n=1 Tax=Bagarius yarrelli TaxID=175774 RepID=A0A556U8I0_BAGYA|nr:hypothetical protein Baya_9501 [Bagarius yarrelli]
MILDGLGKREKSTRRTVTSSQSTRVLFEGNRRMSALLAKLARRLLDRFQCSEDEEGGVAGVGGGELLTVGAASPHAEEDSQKKEPWKGIQAEQTINRLPPAACSICAGDLKTITDTHMNSLCQLTKPFSQQMRSSREKEEVSEKEKERAQGKGLQSSQENNCFWELPK